MSRWRLIDTWEEDFPALSDDELRARIRYAQMRMDTAPKKAKKGVRGWRKRIRQAEGELDRRRSAASPERE